MGDIKNNPYFSYSEFGCFCGRCEYATGRDIDSRVPDIALEIRLALMRPVIVTSACRCDFHNTMVGGSRNSQHLHKNGFKAFDFKVVSAIERYVCVQIALKHGASFGFTSVFMHIDFRGTPMAFTY